MESLFSPAHHRVLIPEVLHNIVARLGKKDLLRIVSICHAWSDLALDYLWRDMRHLLPLLEVLGPMIHAPLVTGDNYWHFPGELESVADAKWQRFARYSTRIRSLIYPAMEPKDRCPKYINPEDISDIVRHHQRRGQPSLLPKLISLSWCGEGTINDLPAILPFFLSPSVRHLRLRNATPSDLASLQGLRNCRFLSLDVQTITLPQQQVPPEREGLVDCVRENPWLQKLALPVCHPGNGLMQLAYGLRELRKLQVTIKHPDLTHVSDTFTEVVRGCRQLHSIDFRLLVGGHGRRVMFHLQLLAPFFELRSLSQLHIDYIGGFTFQENEIIKMGEAWPQIESLRLTSPNQRSCDAPLSSLLLFATHFSPTLVSLHLTLAASEVFGSPKYINSGVSSPRRFDELALKLPDVFGMGGRYHERIGEVVGRFLADGARLSIALPYWRCYRPGAVSFRKVIHEVASTIKGANGEPDSSRNLQDFVAHEREPNDMRWVMVSAGEHPPVLVCLHSSHSQLF